MNYHLVINDDNLNKKDFFCQPIQKKTNFLLKTNKSRGVRQHVCLLVCMCVFVRSCTKSKTLKMIELVVFVAWQRAYESRMFCPEDTTIFPFPFEMLFLIFCFFCYLIWISFGSCFPSPLKLFLKARCYKDVCRTVGLPACLFVCLFVLFAFE